MNYEQLKRRVERAEFLVDARTRQTHAAWDALRLHWREAWTPPRIIVAGLVTGFLSGRSQPQRAAKQLQAVAGPKTLQLVTSILGTASSLQAALAAFTARGAARTADEAAETADDAAQAAASGASVAAGAAAQADAAAGQVPPSERRRQPDPAWERAPSPAEAATDMSERPAARGPRP
jgi:hypothetical protein